MKNKKQSMTAKVEAELDVKFIFCNLGVRDYDGGVIDGVEDDFNNPKMPCVGQDRRWKLTIDASYGKILNWPQGHTASVCYKICDDCVITYHFTDDTTSTHEGYVPSFLSPKENGYGDYAIMDIDQDGYIQDWGARGALDIDLRKVDDYD